MIEPEAPELKLTQQGHLMGTPLYMAPEAFTSGAISAATDLYSLGIVMYEMLSGDPPFNGTIKENVLWHHCFTVPPALPPKKGLDVLVSQLMAKDPSDRPQSAGTVVEEIDRRLKRGALRRFLEDAPARGWNGLAAKTHGHQRWVIAVGTATVTALLAFGLGSLWRSPATQPLTIDEPPQVTTAASPAATAPTAAASASAAPSPAATASPPALPSPTPVALISPASPSPAASIDAPAPARTPEPAPRSDRARCESPRTHRARGWRAPLGSWA